MISHTISHRQKTITNRSLRISQAADQPTDQPTESGLFHDSVVSQTLHNGEKSDHQSSGNLFPVDLIELDLSADLPSQTDFEG